MIEKRAAAICDGAENGSTVCRKSLWSRVRQSARSVGALWSDEHGAWVIVTGLLLPVLIAAAGLGTEASYLLLQHRSLQGAADAAAYAAALSLSYDLNKTISAQNTDIANTANGIVAKYNYIIGTGTDQANVVATRTSFSSLTAVRVTISRPQSAMFASRYLPTLSNSVSATAVINDNNPSGDCLLAMGESSADQDGSTGAISLQGNPSVSLVGCGVFSNSGISIARGGGASFKASSVGTAGTVSGGNEVTIVDNSAAATGGTYTQNNGALYDPYAAVSAPTTSSAGSCVASSADDVTTYCPGIYASGISLKSGQTVLSPGVYILGGELQIGGGGGKRATVTGDGVTLVFYSSSDDGYPSTLMDLSSNAKVTLSAPSTGATAGFLIMGGPNMLLDASNIVFDARRTQNLSGTIYLPAADVSWQGTSVSNPGPCLQLVVNKISFQGHATLSSAGCNLVGNQQPIGSVVSLVD